MLSYQALYSNGKRESMVRDLCIWENILHGIVALNEGKLDLLIGIYRVQLTSSLTANHLG